MAEPKKRKGSAQIGDLLDTHVHKVRAVVGKKLSSDTVLIALASGQLPTLGLQTTFALNITQQIVHSDLIVLC
jgi:hypothetical protein